MARFQVESKLTCDEQSVMSRLKDIQSIPKYWKGTREIHITSDDGEIAYADIRFAFPASGKVKITRLDNGIRIDYLKGPFKGFQETVIQGDKLISVWDVNFNWMFKLMENRNVEHFMEGTRHALMRLQGIEVEPKS